MASGGLVYLAGWLVNGFEELKELPVKWCMKRMFMPDDRNVCDGDQYWGLSHECSLPGVLQLPRPSLFKETFDKLVEAPDFFRKTYLALYRLYYSLSFC